MTRSTPSPDGAIFTFRRVPIYLAALALLALVSFAPQVAAATTITPDTFVDDVTPNGNCTLREAIQAANTDAAVDGCPAGSGTDVIDLTPGTYALTIPGPESGNTVGDLNVLRNLRINGNGATIDASALPSDRVIYIQGVTV